MKRVLSVLGILGILMLIAFSAVWFYLDRQYGISRAPRLNHATVIGEHHALRLMIQPVMAGDLIRDYMSQLGQEPPGFLLNRVLPHEIAILLDTDGRTPELDIQFFLNEGSMGPVIVNMMNERLAEQPGGAVRWASEGVQFPRRGVLTLRGRMPLEPAYLDATASIWGVKRPRPPFSMSGVHFMEVMIDNRYGDAYTFVQLLMGEEAAAAGSPGSGAQDQSLQDLQMQFIANSLKVAERIHITADPGANDSLDLLLTVHCTEESGRSGVETAKTVIDTTLSQAEPLITDMYGFELLGTSRIEGQRVVAELNLRPLSVLLDNLLAGRGGIVVAP